ncbi:uncharacterized protein LOC144145372 [Haemaphysalis longicornis]
MHLYKEPPKGHFYMARELVKNFTMGMWVNTGLPASLRRELHVRTRWIIESGLPERFHKNFVERAKHKSESGPLDAGQSFSFHTLRVEDVSGLFYLLLAGYGTAVVGAVIEQFAHFVSSSRCFRRHI